MKKKELLFQFLGEYIKKTFEDKILKQFAKEAIAFIVEKKLQEDFLAWSKKHHALLSSVPPKDEKG